MNKTTISTKPNGNGALDNLEKPAEAKIDFEQFRVDQNYSVHLQTRKKNVVVPVARPARDQWIVIHPDPDWRMPVHLLEDKDNRIFYMVKKELAPEVTEDLAFKWLVAYVTRSGSPGLWPISMPTDGRPESFRDSARAIVQEHAGQWIRIICSMADKQYTVLETTLTLPVPHWPVGGFQWMLETAFKNRIIKSLDHPLLRSLRLGESYDAGRS